MAQPQIRRDLSVFILWIREGLSITSVFRVCQTEVPINLSHLNIFYNYLSFRHKTT